MLGSLSSNLPSQRTLVLSIAPVLVSFYLLYKLRPFDALTDSKKRGRAESNDQAGPGPVWGGTMRSRPISEDEENVSDSSNEDDDEVCHVYPSTNPILPTHTPPTTHLLYIQPSLLAAR